MKLTSVTFLLFFTSALFGQSSAATYVLEHANQGYSRDYRMWRYVRPDSFIQAHQITEVKVTQSERKFQGKSKMSYQSRTIYDSLGYPIHDFDYNKKGKLKEETIRTVNTKGEVTHLVYNVNGALYFEFTTTYNDSNLIASYFLFRKNKLKNGYRYTYNAQNQLSKTYYYEKDSEQYATLSQYYYENDTGRLLMVEMLDEKGKRKYLWDYSCNDLGAAKRSKLKKESRICESKNILPNGHRQEVWMSQHPGYIARWVTEYDSADRVLTQQYFRGKSGETLSSFTSWAYQDSGIIKQEDIYRGGKKPYVGWTYLHYYDQNWAQHKMIFNVYNRRGKNMNATETNYIYKNQYLVSVVGENLKHPKKTQWITEVEYLPSPAP